MRVGGLQKLSLLDYPGIPSAVIFTQGCNYRCPYCHNLTLMECDPPEEGIRWEEVREFLVRRKGMLSGVVFCGGEPTLQEDLVERIAEVAGMGFRVKLDTNGSHPDCLEKALTYLSFVAMDLKAPFGEAYDRACGTQVDQESVKKSMAILRASKVPYMFRTTISPEVLSPTEAEDIKPMIFSGEDYRVTQAQKVQGKPSWR